MICKLHIEVPAGCVIPRYVCLSWGYSKIAISGLMFLLSMVPVIEALGSIFFGYIRDAVVSISFIALGAMLLADIIHNVMLIVGTHKRKVNNLKKYLSYSKALWVMMPVTLTIFIILFYCDLILFRPYLISQLYTQLVIMCLSIVFQTFVMWQVAQEIENIENNGSVDDDHVTNNKKHVFDGEFSLIFGTINEKEIQYSKMVGETETTSDTAKLNV